MGEEKKRCCKKVSTDSYINPTRPCGAAASVEHDGKWYCKRHDPVAIAKKQAEKNARRAATQNMINDHQRRQWQAQAACEGVADPQPGELLRLRQELAKIKGGA